MGLRFLHRGRNGDADDILRLFDAYFPRAFAYGYSNLGDEAATREVVASAFSETLAEAPLKDEKAFRLILFSSIRSHCRERKRKMPLDIGLAGPERDVITLAFDAGLTSEEVCHVLGSDDASDYLMSALDRMRQTASSSIIPSFFRLT